MSLLIDTVFMFLRLTLFLTRQILKCMWCGQSFRSLADLTTHMSETKHYTKVIPQEQLSTWRAQQQQQQNSPSHSSTPSPALSTQPSPTSMVRSVNPYQAGV